MKHLPKIISALLLSLLLCIPSTLAVFYYTSPMEDVSYDLYSAGEDGEEWPGANGWIFFKNESGKITELTADGFGGYTGLSYPGQTFYYSRELTETLDSPTLQIGVANRTVSIFLDGELLYTDWPELDNRIGHLELPMLEYDRSEPVKVSLPSDYEGKTLTIAQSSPAVSEKQNGDSTVWPCEITLYCGYAYESELIASASKTMLPAVLLFALQLFFLAVFIWYASRSTLFWQLPVFVLAVFFQMCSILIKADFFYPYFGAPPVDYGSLSFSCSIATLFLLLGFYTKRLRIFYLILSGIQWGANIFSLLVQAGLVFEYGDLYLFFSTFPQVTGFFLLLAAAVGIFFLWKHENQLFRHLAHGMLFLFTVYGIFLVICIPFAPEYPISVFTRFRQEIASCLPNFSLRLLYSIVLLSTIAAILIELVEQEVTRRTEREILKLQNELAMESYENLQMQSEEIRILRHDTMKHYLLLRDMAKETPEQLSVYLEELIGQIQNIRPVISSKNQILNIILNGKLHQADSKGITTEIDRSDAPAVLPLTDVQLCCLIANILDNAIHAASFSENPYMKLDFHCKNQHFVFSCENSVSPDSSANKKNPREHHGYGLKIIQQIMQRFGENMFSIEQTESLYKVTIILPL